MKHHLVIDTSVYLTYAAYGKLYRIADAVYTYGLILYADNQLLIEFENNIKKLSLYMPINVEEGIDNLKKFISIIETIPKFKLSPDPKDNFLFDLAIQTNSEVIVTKEKALLGFQASPVPIHDIQWFKETYPVDL